jgi:dolichol-phosphate mannosyltransferase/undecaprenyl-phosphate 4-deoxy-4-formamido-L-arabinose transferase
MNASGSLVSIVIPVYRSAESLSILVSRLEASFKQMNRSVELVLVDDASPDDSWAVLKELKSQHGKLLKIARLLTNKGQHNALLCGLSLARGDIVIAMDDDLQNPPEEIPKLLAGIERGYDLVIGAYDSQKHSALRNAGGNFIDWIIRRIFGLPEGFQLTSFRATKRRVVDGALQMGAVFPYVTCMLLSNASNYANASVRHDPRPYGKSNYNLKRNLYLAANLIFSYSSYPLYFVGLLSFLAFAFSILIGVRTIYKALVYGTSVPGWASTVVIVSFFNALILLCLSMFGLYLLRITQQITRTRVSYTVSELYE